MNNTAEKQKNNKSSWVDEALPKKYLLRFKEAAQFLGVSLSILERLAKEADAIYRYGKVCWVDLRLLLQYLDAYNGK